MASLDVTRLALTSTHDIIEITIDSTSSFLIVSDILVTSNLCNFFVLTFLKNSFKILILLHYIVKHCMYCVVACFHLAIFLKQNLQH